MNARGIEHNLTHSHCCFHGFVASCPDFISCSLCVVRFALRVVLGGIVEGVGGVWGVWGF